jgi:REP element-mobilizing transposase RayT
MARPLRIAYPGAVYHVTARGNARQAIGRDDADRQRFVATLADTVTQYRVRCHAWVLMPNHYHLLLETPESNLSAALRHLNGVYTQAFNRRHRRVGHLFQGRFTAILVEKERYLLGLCRYRDDQDREGFLGTLDHVVARYGWRCHAYCLMTNHYHLLIETPKPTLARGMRQLNGVYSQAFNRCHRRVGHLFQGRYHAILVEKEAHLLELCRYVVLNPVRVRACRTAGHWPWSSYRATAGLAPAPRFLTVDWVLGQFGQGQRQAQARYRTFVREGLGRRPWQDLRGQIYLGTEEFVARLTKQIPRQQEVPRVQRQPVRPRLDAILRRPGDKGIAVAYRQYGYRLREIADYLGVHYATVSRRLQKVEEAGDV